MEQLLQKLAISKAIMDKHNEIKRGQASSQEVNHSKPELQEFVSPTPVYNLPENIISENNITPRSTSQKPITKDSIMNSKLPDEIKKLMIENPITPSNPLSPSNTVLSDELVEAASRLMGVSKPENKPQTKVNTTQPTTNNNDLKKMIKEVVQEVLEESGLIVESTSKTSETLSLRVGQHIFEGKILKIKKIKE